MTETFTVNSLNGPCFAPEGIKVSADCYHFNSGYCRSCTRLALPVDQQVQGKILTFQAQAQAAFGTECVVTPAWQPNRFLPSRTKAKMSVSGSVAEPCIGILDNNFSGKPLLDCPLHVPLINRALAELPRIITEFKLFPYDIPSRTGELKGLILKASRDEKFLLLRFVLRSTEAIPRIEKACKQLEVAIPELCSISANIQPIPHAILEGETEIQLYGSGLLWERYGDLSLVFAPQSFAQVTPDTAEALYRYVVNLIRERKPQLVFDLFCGVGGFSLHAARFAEHVVGIELSSQAIDCAKLAAAENSIANTTFHAADVASFLETYSGPAPDVVICNPPRRGLAEPVRSALTRLAPAQIVYSSCNPQTLFRDIGSLPDFRLESLAPFEMFPLTDHLEVVAHLQHR